MTIEEEPKRKRQKPNKKNDYYSYYYKEKGKTECPICLKSIYQYFLKGHQNTKRCQYIKSIREKMERVNLLNECKDKYIKLITDYTQEHFLNIKQLEELHEILFYLHGIGCIWDDEEKHWKVPKVIKYNELNKLLTFNKHHKINIQVLQQQKDELKKIINDANESEIMNFFDNIIINDDDDDDETEPDDEEEYPANMEEEDEEEEDTAMDVDIDYNLIHYIYNDDYNDNNDGN